MMSRVAGNNDNESEERQQTLAPPPPPWPRGAVSIPRDPSHTPTITDLSSATKTPFIQRCHVHRDVKGGQQPLEHMTVIFEQDDLQLTTISLLGKGGFGHVYAARSNSGELYALKISSKKMTDGDWGRLKKEVTLMSHFSRHPNVVRFITAGRDEESAYVVMECCASRSLGHIIADSEMDISEILWVGWALVNTVAFMHEKGCIHRDLKPQNLLFDFDGNLKVTDFGLSSRISEEQPRKTVAGTAVYMAPEIAAAVYKRMVNADEPHSLRYGREVDTWSIGVVLYVMLTRVTPYAQALEREGALEMERTQKTLMLFGAVAGAAWSWPPGWSGDPDLCSIVDRTLHPDPASRATLQEVLHHPVWKRCPPSCPLSLLQKLKLLESSSTSRHPSNRRSLSRVANNLLIPPAAKKTVEDVLVEGLRRVILMEQRARAQLTLEYSETLNVFVNLLELSKAEGDGRCRIEEDEMRRRMTIENQKMTRRKRRGGSEALVSLASSSSSTATSGAVNVLPRSSRSPRQPSVMLVTPPPHLAPDNETAGGAAAVEGRIVRASPGKYAVVYPGRETSTRWSLRPAISLPRELNNEIEEFKCMNNHIMTKLTAMPYGYNGFDCNVCDREILKITRETPAFRCYKCDYDLCMKCAYQGRLKDVSFVCVSCTKKFTSSAKLHAHSLQCRGPSWSPSPRRSSRMNTMLWDDLETHRSSLLEVQLPEDPKPRHSGCSSRRGSARRASSGGRISVGDTRVLSPEDVGAMVVQHRDATFPDMPDWTHTRHSSAVQGGGGGGGHGKSAVTRGGGDASNPSFTFELPPEVRLSRLHGEGGVKVPLQNSAELEETMDVDAPKPKKGRMEEKRREKDATCSFQFNEKGGIIGIAAQHRAEREASLQNQHQQGNNNNVIVIRAETAAKPQEMQRQSRVPRSVSATRSTNAVPSAATRAGFKSVDLLQAPVGQASTAATPLQNAMHGTREPSISNMMLHGGPPLPRREPGTLQRNPRPIPQAIPPPNFPVPRQPSHSLVHPTIGNSSSSTSGGGGSGSAFLALPREEQHRQQFVGNFLSGGWVRFYSFTNEETVVLYYCLQPGRYGAVFPTEAGVGTAVVDVHSKLILYVPCMNNDSTNRSQPHPHVQTFYDEDVRLLSVQDAHRHLGGVLKSIMGFVKEIARLRAEGLTPAAVHAAYIHQRDVSSVPHDTKFVYVRKVFPDPSGSFTLFRLSNLRSQVVCNTLMDIRWQSDRRHNVGQKYYVLADGTAEPFQVDHTGILAQVETVLSNNFRR